MPPDAACPKPSHDAAPNPALVDRLALAQHRSRRQPRSRAISHALLPYSRRMAADLLAECRQLGIRITLEEDAGGRSG